VKKDKERIEKWRELLAGSRKSKSPASGKTGQSK